MIIRRNSGTLMTAIIKEDDLVVSAEVVELMTPMLSSANQAVTKEKRTTFTGNLVIDWRSVFGRETTLLASPIDTFDRKRVFYIGFGLIDHGLQGYSL